MALPPHFAGHRLTLASDPPAPAPHTLEIYLDYCCPFSARIFDTLYREVVPMLQQEDSWRRRLVLIFRHQVQPWHPSSALMHEAALAVLRLAPDKFWPFSAALFQAQKAFFDAAVVSQTRNQIYQRLDALAQDQGLDPGRLYSLLEVPEGPAADGSLNAGNQLTGDLKTVIKMGRLVSVHVSPTVLFDGLLQPDISSSWTAEQWRQWLEKNIV